MHFLRVMKKPKRSSEKMTKIVELFFLEHEKEG
jgi:hypothetical protein